MVINRLKSGIGDLPLFIVSCLGNVSHMHRHDDIHFLPVRLDPFGLRQETGTLITNARPVLLGLFVPHISVTLSVRQYEQSKIISISFGFSMQRSLRFLQTSSVNAFTALTARERRLLSTRGRSCRRDIVGYARTSDRQC